jgi:hypothetical protein
MGKGMDYLHELPVVVMKERKKERSFIFLTQHSKQDES